MSIELSGDCFFCVKYLILVELLLACAGKHEYFEFLSEKKLFINFQSGYYKDRFSYKWNFLGSLC